MDENDSNIKHADDCPCSTCVNKPIEETNDFGYTESESRAMAHNVTESLMQDSARAELAMKISTSEALRKRAVPAQNNGNGHVDPIKQVWGLEGREFLGKAE